MTVMKISLNDAIKYYHNLIDYNIEQRNYNNKNIHAHFKSLYATALCFYR